jgi:hypothetical protein
MSSLRAIIWRYKRWLVERQIDLMKRIIRDTASKRGEANDPVADLEAEKLLLEKRWLFTAVGQALSSFAMVEESVVGIAAMLLRIKLSEAGLIFYSILNFNTWLSIVGELFKMEPGYKESIKEWNKISSKLRELKNIRDRLAHQTILSEQNKSGLAIRPARFDTRIESKRRPPLDFDQINSFTDDLADMQMALAALITAMTPNFAIRASQKIFLE